MRAPAQIRLGRRRAIPGTSITGLRADPAQDLRRRSQLDLPSRTLGTDTGGSVRNPAALCGVAGLMPTYGRVSRRGVIPYSFSLDHVGPLAWTALDCALVLSAIAGHDPEDPGSAVEKVADFAAGIGGGVNGMRVGWLRHFYEDDMTADDETRQAMSESAELLRSLGADVKEVRARPLLDYHDCKLILGAAEFWAVHERDFAEKFHLYGEDLKDKDFPRRHAVRG